MEPLIRQAEETDGPAIARLRRDWTQEQLGGSADPDFELRFAAWYAQEASRRIIWLAEVDGRVVGMVNLAVFERMPGPGAPLAAGVTWAMPSCSRSAGIRASASACSTPCSITPTGMAWPAWS